MLRRHQHTFIYEAKDLLKIVSLVFQELQKIPFAFSLYAAFQHMMEFTRISKPFPPHEFKFPEQSHNSKRPQVPLQDK